VKHDVRAALWVCVSVTLFLSLFHRSELVGSDEVGVYQQTAGLARRGDLSMPPIIHTYAGRDGRLYSHFAVGQSVLALPFYALGSVIETWGSKKLLVVLSGPRPGTSYWSPWSPHAFSVLLLPLVATGLMAAVFYLFQRLLDVAPTWAAVAAIAATLTTYVAYMSAYFLRHSLETTAILSAFYCFARFARGSRLAWLLAGSGFAAATFLIRLPAAIASVPIAAFLLWVLRRRFGSGGSTWRNPDLWRALGLLAGPVILGFSTHAVVNYLRWGAWLESPMMAHRARFATPLSVSGVANLVGPGSSVFLYSPLLVLVPVLAAAGWRRERPLVLLGLGNFAVFWLFFSLYDFWTGLWSAPGPRYLTATIPLLLLPLGLWLQQTGTAGRAVFFAAAGVGLLIQVALLTTRWPDMVVLMGYREMGTPEFPFTFLFVPEMSPVLAALRFFVTGQANGTWLAQLARGWPGFEGAPAAAAALVGAWILGLVLCGLRLKASLAACADTRA
jgi:hypothetical protein